MRKRLRKKLTYGTRNSRKRMVAWMVYQYVQTCRTYERYLLTSSFVGPEFLFDDALAPPTAKPD